MVKLLMTALVLALLTCACETTAPREGAAEKADGPIEVTVGGSVQIRGQYQNAD